MAHGGGTWLVQNKKLPGTYINFSSISKASATLSDRGVAAVPLTLGWGEVGTVRLVEQGEFLKDSFAIFGYAYDAAEMFPLREMFKHATKIYCYRLGASGQVDGIDAPAVKASCTYADAKYAGTRGNDITIVISRNVDDATKYNVITKVGSRQVDNQTVTAMSGLTNNAWVDFKTSAEIAETTGTALTNGANGTTTVSDYQDFLNAIESYAYNALCCPATDSTTIALFETFTRRVRDDLGAKFQLVAWESTADYEGVIGCWNESTHSTLTLANNALVYWLTGAEAAVAVNRSLTNTKYNGELTVDVDYTQSQLESAITAGKLMFHNVNGEVRILEDINTLVTLEENKGAIFQSNQTIRVCDIIANDIAVLFNTRYLGIVQNDATGRASLWNDIVYYIRQLEKIRAVEAFDPETVTCELGSTRNSVELTVNGLNIVNAMSKLYMSVIIQ